MRAVQTPEGIFCEACLPEAYLRHTTDVFTLHDDDQFETYPICEACGHKHVEVALTAVGEKYELETAGPRPGDLLLTQTGPALHLTELSVVDEAVIGVFNDLQMEYLQAWVKRHLRDHPGAVVWRMDYLGVVFIDEAWQHLDQVIPPRYLVNHRDR